MIGKKFTSADLAYYNQGQKFPALLVTNIVESLGRVMFPVMADLQQDRQAVTALMRKFIRTSAFILTPCVAGLIAVSDTFVRVVLTEKWMACVPYMRILSLVYITRPLSTVFQKALLSIGKSGAILFHEIVTSVATILLLIASVFLLNEIAYIAWSFVAVMVLGIWIQVIFISRNFEYSFVQMVADYVPILLVSCLMGGAAWFAGRIAVGDGIKLVIQILVGGVAFLALAALLNLKAYRETKDIAQRLWAMVKNRRGGDAA